jgi:peroxiredoxin
MNAGRRIIVAVGVGVVALAVVAWLLLGGGVAEPSKAGTVAIARAGGPPLDPGLTIPVWSAPSLDGETLRWSEQLGGPIVLMVWSPSCATCAAQLAHMVEQLRTHPDVHLVTISTAYQPSGPSSQDVVDDAGVAPPVAIDDEAQTLRSGLGVDDLPTTYFVTADGTVAHRADVPLGILPDGHYDPTPLETLLTQLEDASPQD